MGSVTQCKWPTSNQINVIVTKFSPLNLIHCRYDKLTGCWSADPSVRPSAAELTDYFQQLMRLDVEAPAVSDTAVNMDTLCTQDN